MKLGQKYVPDSIHFTFYTTKKEILQFFHVLHSKSNCFGTSELHVVNLIVILLYCDYPHRFDIVLFLGSN